MGEQCNIDDRYKYLRLEWLRCHSSLTGFVTAWGQLIICKNFHGRVSQRQLELMLGYLAQFKSTANVVCNRMIAIAESYQQEE